MSDENKKNPDGPPVFTGSDSSDKTSDEKPVIAEKTVEISQTPPEVPSAPGAMKDIPEPVMDDDDDSNFVKYVAFAALGIAIAALIFGFLKCGSSELKPSSITDGSITGAKLADGSISILKLDDEVQAMIRSGTESSTDTAAKIKEAEEKVKEAEQKADDAKAKANETQKKETETGAETVAFKTVIKNSKSNTVQLKTAESRCPSGSKLVGGGANITGGEDVVLKSSGPILDKNGSSVGWKTVAEDLTESKKSWVLSAVSVCAVKGAGK